jgi:hypothetical protein
LKIILIPSKIKQTSLKFMHPLNIWFEDGLNMEWAERAHDYSVRILWLPSDSFQKNFLEKRDMIRM